MKSILLLALLAVAGCSSFVSTEELEARAMETGDWSEVERRERILARRDLRAGPSCPGGSTGYCETSFGEERCRCIDADMLRDYFEN